MSTAGAPSWPRARADLLADVEHRRLVALALADHDPAVDLAACPSRARIASTATWSECWRSPRPMVVRGGDGRLLGDADEVLLEEAVEADVPQRRRAAPAVGRRAAVGSRSRRRSVGSGGL